MEEQKKPFVREQIKEKPINRQQILRRAGISALCGGTFALTALAVLLLASFLLRGTNVHGAHSTEGVLATEGAVSENPEHREEHSGVSSEPPDPERSSEMESASESGGKNAVAESASESGGKNPIAESASESGGKNAVAESASESGGKNAVAEPASENGGQEKLSTEASQNGGSSGKKEPDTQEPHAAYTLEDYQQLQDELFAIGRRANRSIVTVTRVVSDTDWFNNPYEIKGLASGVIFRKSGGKYKILTGRKDLQDAERISVTFINGTTVEAEIESVDGNTGLTVLSVEEELLDDVTKYAVSVAHFGKAEEMNSGALTLALGSPQGTNYSILAGTITSTDNEVSEMDANYRVFTTDMIAGSDASGVLINLEGDVIGMVLQDFGALDDTNVLTAVWISDLEPVIDQLAAGKRIPGLGLYVTTVTESIVREYHLPRGVYVKSIAADAPAIDGGIQSGDVITAINDAGISSVEEYQEALLDLKEGKACQVTVLRSQGKSFREIICEVKVSVR